MHHVVEIGSHKSDEYKLRFIVIAGEAEEEERKAEKVVNAAEHRGPISSASAVIWEAFALVFIAELSDRTQFATIFLATAPAFTFAGLLVCWPAPSRGILWSISWR